MTELTLGQKRVRATFNPSNNSTVDWIKLNTATIIDHCAGEQHVAKDGEAKRLWALALTAYEEAAMWAVKAATSGS